MDVAAPAAQPAALQETTGGGGSGGAPPDDSLVIHPYLCAVSLKVPAPGRQQKDLEKLASERDGKRYASALLEARQEFSAGTGVPGGGGWERR